MIRTIFGALLVLLFTACSKKEEARPGAASLMIFNALPDVNMMKTNFSTTVPPVFVTANSLIYAFFNPTTNLYHRIAGSSPLTLFKVPDTMQKSTPLYNLSLDLPEGSMQSLFLAGTSAAPETVLVKDEVLYFPEGDSAMGMRFVNLMPENIPVTINIKSNPDGSEVDVLPYKGVTEFKKYPVKMGVTDYVFEFRNATNGNLIASYKTEKIANNGQLEPNTWLYKNFALALVGETGGSGARVPKIVRIGYSRNF